MKWTVVVVVLAAALAGYVFWPGGEPATEAPASVGVAPDATIAPEAASGAAGQAGRTAADPDTAAEIERLEQEIQTLMADFETYRNDADRRDQIQAEIDAKLAAYNELILPIALSEIKASE